MTGIQLVENCGHFNKTLLEMVSIALVGIGLFDLNKKTKPKKTPTTAQPRGNRESRFHCELKTALKNKIYPNKREPNATARTLAERPEPWLLTRTRTTWRPT
jgi:hypothetical protein